MTTTITIEGSRDITMELDIFQVLDSQDKELSIDQAWTDSDGDLRITLNEPMFTEEDARLVNYIKALNIKTKEELIEYISSGSAF